MDSAFSDGISWKNSLRPGQLRKFTARDSFNVHVGNNRLLDYSLNGKPLFLNASDVAIFQDQQECSAAGILEVENGTCL